MKSEPQGPVSGDRPEAAAEQSEDRARTVGQPLPWTAARASYASVKRRLGGQIGSATHHAGTAPPRAGSASSGQQAAPSPARTRASFGNQ